jgi:hypothetical protein
MRATLLDATAGSEDAHFEINVDVAGTNTERLSFNATEAVLNEGSADLDFRVESNGNANMLFGNGGTNRVHFGGSSGDREFNFEGADNLRLLLRTNDNSVGACQLQFGDSDNSQIGRIMYEHDTDDMTFHVAATEMLRIDSDNNNLSTGGETAGDVGAGGLCLNQGGADSFIFTAKSSDIAHGNTDTLETDSYFGISKSSGDSGGVTLASATEHNQSIDLLALFTNANTTTGTSATGVVRARAWLKSGTGSTASLNADQNIFTAGAGNDVKFIVKADGDIFYDGADQGAYDSYDDAMLVRSWDLSHNKNVIDSKFDAFVKYNHEDLAKAELVGREEDGTPNHFISLTGMQRLHNGAIWQQYEKTEKLANAMYELAKAAVGEDKANEILEQNEIKLLN